MIWITKADFQKSVSDYSDKALQAPVVITNDGDDQLVLISLKAYKRLTGDHENVSPETEQMIRDSIAEHKTTLDALAKDD